MSTVIRKMCYEGFLQELKSSGSADRTISAYMKDLTHCFEHLGFCFEDAADEELASIRAEQITGYLQSLGRKGASFSTVKRNLASVRRFFDYLVSSGSVRQNPAKDLRLSSLEGEPLSEERILSIFALLASRSRLGGVAIHLRDELILLFMIFLGVREYRIPKLTLQNLRRGEYGLSLRLTRHWTAPIDGVILSRLHAYLKLREGSCDALFLAVRRHRHIASSAVGDLLQGISDGVRVSLEPRILHSTYLWLQNNPEKCDALLAKIAVLES